jgi:hypothetical protein
MTGVYSPLAWGPALTSTLFAAAIFLSDSSERRTSLTRRTALAGRF